MAVKYNQSLFRGDTYEWPLIYKTGIPPVATSVAGQGWVFTCRSGADDSILFSASVGSGITLEPGAVMGLIDIMVQTGSLNLPLGTHKYDLERTIGTVVETMVYGQFVIHEDQSR